MPLNLKELAENRIKLSGEARSLVETAKKENRDMTAEENEKFDKIFSQVDELRTQIDAAEASEKRTKQLEGEARWAEQSAGRRTAPEQPGAPLPGGEKHNGKPVAFYATDEYRSAYGKFLR